MAELVPDAPPSSPPLPPPELTGQLSSEKGEGKEPSPRSASTTNKRASVRLSSDASETSFDETPFLEIPRQLVDAWNGEVTLDFKAPQLRDESDGSRSLEYVIEVIWEVRQ